ncbi:MAG: hypothetical protein KR126chlam2_00313 [Chlamydiae bacterium]|nr:hypothetical protein [Chlamydiota bacterium]
MNPFSFINENYTIAFQSENLSSPEEAEIVLLCDRHDDAALMLRNAQLIDLFVKESKVMLVEGIPSMVEIDPRTRMSSFYVKSSVKVMGWDRGVSTSMWGCSSKIIDAVLEKERKQAVFLLKFRGSEDSMNEEEVTLKSECDRSFSQFMEIMKEEHFDHVEMAFNTFQTRNQAMIETLEKTKHSMSRRFVIAGEFHLIQEKGNNDPRMSVAPLRDYLRDKKAVILKHKYEQLV